MFIQTPEKAMFEVIDDERKWDAIISDCDTVDFYHTYAYHNLAKKPEEKAILFSFKESDRIIALPLLLRPIENTTYFDATSVYGYPGPITKNQLTSNDYKSFQKHFHEFCSEYRIVSVFSRLNPFIPNQERCIEGLGSIATHGKTIYIDLESELAAQKAKYNKRLKTYINKSRNKYIVREGSTDEDLDLFMSLYYSNMDRVSANESYYFSKAYFKALFEEPSFDSTLLFAIDGETNDIAGAAIFIKYGSFVQYHLSGAKEAYFNLHPTKLLIDEMRIRATNQNASFFNLGGGVGGREDSLFYFKSGYSKDFKPFKIWKYKVNPAVYADLVKNVHKEHIQEDNDCFFPLYRNGNNQNRR